MTQTTLPNLDAAPTRRTVTLHHERITCADVDLGGGCGLFVSIVKDDDGAAQSLDVRIAYREHPQTVTGEVRLPPDVLEDLIHALELLRNP